MAIEFDVTKFRELFMQFADAVVYPDDKLSQTWQISTCYVSDADCGRLRGDCRGLAIYLMMAHLLYLEAKANATPGVPQAVPGARGGVITSAAIDKVSVSFLAPPVRDNWDWWLQQTPYGGQLLALLSSFVGGFSVGGLPEQDAFRKVYGMH